MHLVLVLHGLGSSNNLVSSWEDTELLFPKYDSNNMYIAHNCCDRLPNLIRSQQFDGIIFTSTFLDWVKRIGLKSKWMNQYEWIIKTDASKFAFPQDDYWLSEEREKFYITYKVQYLFPFVDSSSWEELFPKFINSGGKIFQGYTLYLTNKIVQLLKNKKPWNERLFDVVYRASGNPTYPNQLGEIKAKLGQKFLDQTKECTSLKINISTNSKAFITGDNWYEFLLNSKAVLGSNSGSSINVRNLAIAKRLINTRKKYNDKPIAEIEKIALEEKDRNKTYTGISPRNIEAGLLGTLQILCEGNYSKILEPNIHYIPIRPDASNAKEIITKITNEKMCNEIIENCKKQILSSKQLYPESIFSLVLNEISKKKKNKKLLTKKEFIILLNSYKKNINSQKIYKIFTRLSFFYNTKIGNLYK
jgi:hypothetical protein